MAGDWIKVEMSTLDKPEVLRLAHMLEAEAEILALAQPPLGHRPVLRCPQQCFALSGRHRRGDAAGGEAVS